MKLWLLDYHPAYADWEFEHLEDFNRLAFDGQPMLESWVPPKLKCTPKGQRSDFLKRHNGALLITEKAKALFERHIHPGEAEFLPVEHEGETVYFAHVLNLVDCIDAANSQERRVGDTLAEYKRYAFHEHLAAPHRMLRVKFHEGDRLVLYPFVGDTLQDAIANSDLAGYQLIEAWDSEHSWQQKDADYQAMQDALTASLTKTFDFSNAVQLSRKKGMTVYSGKWAIRHDSKEGLLLGDLLLDGTYSWMNPIYLPPILLGLTWGIKDPEPGPSGLMGKLSGVFSGGRRKS